MFPKSLLKKTPEIRDDHDRVDASSPTTECITFIRASPTNDKFKKGDDGAEAYQHPHGMTA